jgi:hypothetical protein
MRSQVERDNEDDNCCMRIQSAVTLNKQGQVEQLHTSCCMRIQSVVALNKLGCRKIRSHQSDWFTVNWRNDSSSSSIASKMKIYVYFSILHVGKKCKLQAQSSSQSSGQSSTYTVWIAREFDHVNPSELSLFTVDDTAEMLWMLLLTILYISAIEAAGCHDKNVRVVCWVLIADPDFLACWWTTEYVSNSRSHVAIFEHEAIGVCS